MMKLVVTKVSFSVPLQCEHSFQFLVLNSMVINMTKYDDFVQVNFFRIRRVKFTDFINLTHLLQMPNTNHICLGP